MSPKRYSQAKVLAKKTLLYSTYFTKQIYMELSDTSRLFEHVAKLPRGSLLELLHHVLKATHTTWGRYTTQHGSNFLKFSQIYDFTITICICHVYQLLIPTNWIHLFNVKCCWSYGTRLILYPLFLVNIPFLYIKDGLCQSALKAQIWFYILVLMCVCRYLCVCV